MNSKEKDIRIIRTFILEDEKKYKEDFYKKNFCLDSNKVKMSTIKSFKGAQSRAIVAYIPMLKKFNQENLKEVYTCISRLKADIAGSHLIVVTSDSRINEFF